MKKMTDLTSCEIELIKERMESGLTLEKSFVGAFWTGLDDVAIDVEEISEIDYLAIME